MLDGFPQRDFVLWVFMYPINISPFRPFRLYSVSILCLYPGYHAAGYHAPSIPHGLSRLYHHCTATTPVYIFPGYHAIVYFYSWVITPKLPRSTTHVHGVITPAIDSSLYFTFTGYYATCSSHLHHHRGATRTNLLHRGDEDTRSCPLDLTASLSL